MRPPTIALVFNRKHTATAREGAVIEIRVTHGRTVTYFTTSVKVCLGQWNKLTNSVTHRLDAPVLNERIQSRLREVTRAVETLTAEGRFSMAMLRSLVSAPATMGQSPLEWIGERIETRNDLREGTRRHHRVMLRRLTELGRVQVWGDFTLATIEEFDRQLRATISNDETVYSYHKRLRVYLADAVRHDLLAASPYDKFRAPRGKVGDTIRYLTEEERTQLERIPLTGALEKARDLFIFCCYTGLAYSDMAKLQPEDFVPLENGRRGIIDKRVKTATPYRIVLLPPAEAILSKWHDVLPVMSNQKYNQFLKIVGEAAGITQPLTSHMARHTFATWALGRGVRIEVVSKMLGHTSIQTTQIYAKVLQREVDAGYELLL